VKSDKTKISFINIQRSKIETSMVRIECLAWTILL